MNKAIEFIMWLAYEHPQIYKEYYGKFLDHIKNMEEKT